MAYSVREKASILLAKKGDAMLVMLMNSGKKDVYVLGTLEWGHAASLLFHIFDASGKEIKPPAFPDDKTLIPRGDNSAFVKLRPSHFLGTDFYAPLNLLGLDRTR